VPKDPGAPWKAQADLTTAAAHILDAATAEPLPERFAHLAEQLEEALVKAQAPVKSSEEGR
jgi:hypothetical protein